MSANYASSPQYCNTVDEFVLLSFRNGMPQWSTFIFCSRASMDRKPMMMQSTLDGIRFHARCRMKFDKCLAYLGEIRSESIQHPLFSSFYIDFYDIWLWESALSNKSLGAVDLYLIIPLRIDPIRGKSTHVIFNTKVLHCILVTECLIKYSPDIFRRILGKVRPKTHSCWFMRFDGNYVAIFYRRKCKTGKHADVCPDIKDNIVRIDRG